MMRCTTLLMLAFLLLASACSVPLPAPKTTPAPDLTASATARPQAASATPLSPTVAPTPTAPEPTPCVDQLGRIENTAIQTALLSNPLQVRVYTPPCFDSSAPVRYPVLYLLHGQNYTNAQWDDLGADEAAAELSLSGQSRSFLIVMPGEELDLIDTRDSSYGQALIDSLIPWVDQTYPTCAEAACRAIGGISRGAGWAVHLALRHADTFSAAGAHSLAVFTGEATHLPETLAAIPAGMTPRFYLDSGRYDRYLDSAVEFEQALNRYGVDHEWYLFEGIHDDAYWAAHIGKYMRWYAELFNEL